MGRSRGSRRRLGPLGGVLGDVRGDGPIGQRLAAVEVGRPDRADVQLPSEGEGMRPPVDLWTLSVSSAGSALDGISQQLGRGPGRRRRFAALRAVDADDRMEVDSTALLVLGHLREGDPGVVPEGPLGEPGALGNLSAEVDREASPEGTSRSTDCPTRQKLTGP